MLRNLFLSQMKKYILLLFLLQSIGSFVFAQYKMPQTNYEQQAFILKINPQYSEFCLEETINIPAIQDKLALLEVEKLYKIYPHHQSPKEKYCPVPNGLTSVVTCISSICNEVKEIPTASFEDK